MTHLFRNIAYILTILLLILLTKWGGVATAYLQNKVVEHTHDTLVQVEVDIDTITNTITTEKPPSESNV